MIRSFKNLTFKIITQTIFQFALGATIVADRRRAPIVVNAECTRYFFL